MIAKSVTLYAQVGSDNLRIKLCDALSIQSFIEFHFVFIKRVPPQSHLSCKNLNAYKGNVNEENKRVLQ